MILHVLLVAAFASALVGTYIPWSKIQGMTNGPRKAVCAIYLLSWVVIICFGIEGVYSLYELKEVLR